MTLKNFDALSDFLREKLLSIAHTVNFSDKGVLFQRGDIADNLYFILKGNATVGISTDDGKEIIIDKFVRGDFFGEIDLFNNSVRTTDATVFPGSSIAYISKTNLFSLLDSCPEMYREFLSVFCGQFRLLIELIDELAFKDSIARIASRLLRLTEEMQEKNIEISQEELAKMTGISREVINRNLNSMQQKKLISVGRKHISILDVYGLSLLRKKEG